jgi:Domain of unknown function (DUF1707)
VVDVGSVAPSEAERDRVTDFLKQAVGSGILSLEEFESRLDAVLAPRTVGELQSLIRWVPTPPAPRRRIPIGMILATVLAVTALATVPWAVSSLLGDATNAAGAKTAVGSSTAGSAQPPATGYAGQIAATIEPQCNGPVGYEQTEPESFNATYNLPVPKNVAACVRQAGLTLTPTRPLSTYTHVHVDIYVGAGGIRIPAGVGVDPTSGKAAALFTRSDSGIIYVANDGSYTLGELFQVWGQPIGDGSIGTLRVLASRQIYWFINGVATTQPGQIVLHAHDEIVAFEDLKGSPVNAPSSFDWPPGY